eukprot:TRINITY_DN13318_c0_g1_i1.p1 TRINITY_DN13318_c0_g1~~TRINITY_DN13318_c0_g1_i1.p1  ORF type:complete len:444 (+),score=78.93 TRINITY_DN13318_c0_g1_i1:61-1392(+)
MSTQEPAAEHHFIDGAWPVAAAWLGFSLVSVCALRNAYLHLLNFSRPDLQPHVLRIILVGPIYAFSSSLCLSMQESACFFIRSVRDIWEAVVIYSFLTLIIEYMGGEHLCLHSISQRDEAVPHLFPMNLCMPPIATENMIRVPKIGALQFVVVKPVVAVMSIVVYALGQLQNWYYQWTLFIIYNISYSVALYALYLIYWASHEQEALQSKRPLLKFISVKMIVFLTFWQALILPSVPLPGSISRWEDFILACEMVAFALLMNIAFSWREFKGTAIRFPSPEKGGAAAKAGTDLIDLEVPAGGVQAKLPDKDSSKKASSSSPSLSSSPEPVGRGKVAQNARAAFCPSDIMKDASTNFSWRYQQHVLIESAQDYELESAAQSAKGDSIDLLADTQAKAGSSGLTLSALKNIKAPVFKLGRSRAEAANAEASDPGPVQAAQQDLTN